MYGVGGVQRCFGLLTVGYISPRLELEVFLPHSSLQDLSAYRPTNKESPTRTLDVNTYTST